MDVEALDRAEKAHEAGCAALKAGDTELAITHFERAAADYPHFKTLELLGEAWLRKGDALRAIVPLAAATTLNRQVRAPSFLAEAFLALGETLKAHEIALVALERESHNRKARAVFEATVSAYKKWSEQ